MDISKWINDAKNFGYAAVSQASEALGAGVGFIKTSVGRAWLLGSTETSFSYDRDRFDEKHYFLIPDRRSDVGYSLHVMRCLPGGVPPINDLPKRRLFHLPNAHAMPTLEHILLVDAREAVESESPPIDSLGGRLNEIADQIDRLDGKVFNGVLLIGGLVALINPLAGAAVAMKALIPSIGLLLSKYGLQYVGDAANSRVLAQRIRNAEKDVLQQFRDSKADSIVNPVLSQLDRAIETSEYQYEPVLDFNSDNLSFGKQDRDRLLKLTCQAIVNTYDDVLDDPSTCDLAKLGPEDIRFLRMLRQLASDENE
ncbi:MAG: hypothetical protein FJ308_02145 [Planctomycetes bacterium]|nr:hypothetical protein [Planctomycetota bacterium]